MGEGQSSSRANHIGLMDESKEDVPTFLLSHSECQQMIGLLSKIKTVAVNTNEGNQLLEMLNSKEPFANFVGNIPTYEDLSGKAFTLSQHNKDVTWILDSGVSDHIVFSSSFLTSFQHVFNHTIKFPDGITLPVSHIGTVKFSPYFILHNVLCVPLFQPNLISISKLAFDSLYIAIFLK
jgi:hypothetical protein